MAHRIRPHRSPRGPERLPDRVALTQGLVERAHEDPRAGHRDGVREGDHAPHARAQERRRDRAEHRGREVRRLAGFQQRHRHVVARQEIPEARPFDEVVLRVRLALRVGLLEAKRANAGLLQVHPVSIEVHEMERPPFAPRRIELTLHLRERGRHAKLHLDKPAERRERIEAGPQRRARVDEPDVARTAHDPQDPQRQRDSGTNRRARREELPAQDDVTQEERALPIVHELPWQRQRGRVRRRDREELVPRVAARAPTRETTTPRLVPRRIQDLTRQIRERVNILVAAKRPVERASDLLESPFERLRAGRSALATPAQPLFEVPAVLGLVFHRERRGHAERRPLRAGAAPRGLDAGRDALHREAPLDGDSPRPAHRSAARGFPISVHLVTTLCSLHARSSAQLPGRRRRA